MPLEKKGVVQIAGSLLLIVLLVAQARIHYRHSGAQWTDVVVGIACVAAAGVLIKTTLPPAVRRTIPFFGQRPRYREILKSFACLAGISVWALTAFDRLPDSTLGDVLAYGPVVALLLLGGVFWYRAFARDPR